MPHPLLASHAHRPWPLPASPWVMTQTWSKLLFAHWSLPPELIRPLIPPALTLDTFDGKAWIGVVPFAMSGVRFRGTPYVPGTHTFLEMNVRTYVTHQGKAGVWFFSLDASSWLAVEAARIGFHLPYFHASMSLRQEGSCIHYTNERTDRRSGAGVFRASYGPTGPVYASQPGTLDHFLTERYCLYSASARGQIYRAEIQHLPWPLQPAEANIEVNTITHAFNIQLPPAPPLLHYVDSIPVLAWYLQRVSG